MAAFDYVALDSSGREKKGVVEADTPRNARQKLRAQELTPLDLSESHKKSSNDSHIGRASKRRGIKVGELALVTRQIATLVSTGTPLEEALSAVARNTDKNRIASLILAVRARVLEGHSFAAALREFPRVFPEIYQATVDAGEQSGHLDAVLERLADYLEERQEANATIKKALIYPSLLVVFSIGIVMGLLGYVVPQVVQVFDSMDQQLPILTRAMLSVSAFVREWGLVIFIAIAILVFLYRYAMHTESFKMRMHSLWLKVPIFSKLIRAFNTAQFARTLSILAASGVPVLQALGIASQVITNRPMRKAVQQASSQVREGSTLSGALERTGYFPPMLMHLISSGEASGQLDLMLDKAASFQERELDSALAIFLGIFEPVVILIMGALVLLIVLAILLPIFEMNQLVG